LLIKLKILSKTLLRDSEEAYRKPHMCWKTTSESRIKIVVDLSSASSKGGTEETKQ
jgi:hypothetical protein